MKAAFKHLLSITVAISAVTIVQSCTGVKSEAKKVPVLTEAIPVSVLPLTVEAADGAIEASGQLTTDTETTLSFKTGGIVKSVLVKEGDKVRRGQLLATIDPTEINAMVSQARYGYEKAERDLQRAKALYQDSVATLEQFQNAQTAFDVAREQLEQANFNRAHSEVRASADGYVLKKFVNAGQLVGGGDPVVRTNKSGNGNWVLKVGVSDRDWALISPGEKATVVVDAFPGTNFQARVERKSEAADPLTGTFSVEVKLEDVSERLATGMFGKASIKTNNSVRYWAVPYESVLDAEGNDGFVFVTNDRKTAIRQSVTIHSFDHKHILISSGLENARELVVAGSAYLSDGKNIRITE